MGRIKFTALLFSACIGTVISRFHEKEHDDADIRAFYNTNETIWTCNTTTTQRPCQLDDVQNITDKDIDFHRDFLDTRKIWTRMKLHGEFTLWESQQTRSKIPYDSMNLLWRDKFYRQEILHYQSYQDKCAVFVFPSNNNRNIRYNYELRAWNSSVNNIMHTECWRRFFDVAKRQRIRRAYFRGCQKLMAHRREWFSYRK
uniref:Lipocalin n=1 Tax=Rhipicephalus zambeziensis TaxID=60191 RepID=A0A224YCK5_9ACAR